MVHVHKLLAAALDRFDTTKQSHLHRQSPRPGRTAVAVVVAARTNEQ